jgi:hypothetical protein
MICSRGLFCGATVHERTIPIPAEISPSTEHAGWRKRGYLPHYDATGAVQHIVFRLADALPAKLAARLERAPVKDRWDAAERARPGLRLASLG